MNTRTDESGFTLLESLFQLLIAVAFLHLIVLFLLFKDTVHTQLTDSHAVEWELFMVDLQRDLSDVISVRVSADGKSFTVLNASDQTVDYSTVNHVIRRRIGHEGHVPLLTSVQTAVFSLEDEYMEVSVLTSGSRERTRRVAVGLAEE
ncbi:competence type IV pilus minor pilin ComGF [Sporosarcina koreensis]|uniref:competence type IV pilus minor pilin ComGF n=1 Tax=Sporosarcina koreensis TaxID=334735 RepID=UPI00058C8BE2|nr:competence type IV pilus minor pilin ComGF [Sporosarcina koreensis]